MLTYWPGFGIQRDPPRYQSFRSELSSARRDRHGRRRESKGRALGAASLPCRMDRDASTQPLLNSLPELENRFGIGNFLGEHIHRDIQSRGKPETIGANDFGDGADKFFERPFDNGFGCHRQGQSERISAEPGRRKLAWGVRADRSRRRKLAWRVRADRFGRRKPAGRVRADESCPRTLGGWI